MVLEVRTIELRVVNATNLKKVKKFKQQRCYVVAYIYPAQRQATLVDTSGGVNPTWDASVSLNCYETDLQPADGSSGDQWPPSTTSSSTKSITIDIYSHTGGFFTRGDKVVGTVKVPLNQIASVTRIAGLSLMSFDVYRPSGKAQGKLNLIVKLGEKRAITESEQQPPSYAYYDTKVSQASSPMMPPMTTSYSTASSALFTDSVYDPNLNTYSNQNVQIGYPAANCGFFPLRKEVQQGGPIQPPPSTPPQKQLGGRRRARRRRMKIGGKKATAAIIVGGIILAAIML